MLDDSRLDDRQRRISFELITQVRQHLPPGFLSALERPVELAWSTRLPPQVIGRAGVDGRILLNRRWLSSLVVGERVDLFAARNHGSLQAELLATIIHELAHLYDRARVGPPGQQMMLRRCRWQKNSVGTVGLARQCRGNAERRHTFSDDPRLLDLAGWTEQVGGRGERFDASDQPDRSPDAYEQTSPAEFVAVNLEYFLLDPAYACRRPALHAYFARHFGWAPASLPCDQGVAFVRGGLSDDQAAVGSIDPARVYAVHYLLAEPNRNWASRWGHSMLRLVICAPGRDPGPDCLLDLDHHLVLSFRAFVNALQLSSWDGLTGEYPSRLFILPLSRVVDEYTRLELRGLQSIPLKLDAHQRAALVRQAAQLHWSYDGRYYFISNNCAVETLRLLRIGTADERLTGLESVTPVGALQLLDAQGMADPAVLDDRRAAMRAGYYFDSHRERQEAMLEVLEDELGLRFDHVEQWLEHPADARRALISQVGQRGAAALLLLEQAAHDRQVLLAQQALLSDYLSQAEALQEAGMMMQALVGKSTYFSRPAQVLDRGYGLPQPEEIAVLEREASARKLEWQALADELENRLPDLLAPERRAELEGARRNLALIAERLRALHRQNGGLTLP
ncbi:DUF4105 domain-containing protein [Halopseudomonas nanhaiensis]|uniref:DUF7844 domain-containing protein n=1 Tax=Halopseudomonas nanhaiensis TaxID=2830842 RepID=UPI003C2E9F3B